MDVARRVTQPIGLAARFLAPVPVGLLGNARNAGTAA